MSLDRSVYQSIHEAWEGPALEALKEFIRIPALSRNFDSEWESRGILKKTLASVSEWGKNLFPTATFELITPDGIPPALYIEIPAFGGHTGQPAFFYGHLDKQPETVGWNKNLGPWTPVIENDRLYGRGSVDDGYNYFLVLSAIKALEDNNVPHPVIRCLYETDEESGSRDLEHYLTCFSGRIGSPAFLAINDLGAADDSRLWLTQSLRGMMALTLTVKVLDVPSHSGIASGIVPSSFRIIRQLLDRIEDARTGEIKIPELQVEIPEEIRRSAKVLSEVSDMRSQFDWAGNTHAVSDNALDAMLEGTWKATLSVIGADGLPPAGNAGNLIRESTSLRLSFRTPPTADAEAALRAATRILTENPPYGAEVTVTNAEAGSGFKAPVPTGWLHDALHNASLKHFGKEPGSIFCGASIGTLRAFSRCFPDSPFINTGALLPGTNAHAPNEWLPLTYTEKLTCVFADLIAGIPEGEK